MLYELLTIAVVVVALGVFWSWGQLKNLNKERDDTPSAGLIKHPVAANPGLILYILFPIMIVVGALIWMVYYP